jgi:hypothetical protein
MYQLDTTKAARVRYHPGSTVHQTIGAYGWVFGLIRDATERR